MQTRTISFDYEAALSGCRAGESRAMRALYDHEAGRMLGVARRIVRDPTLAEDVVHEAFVGIWRHADTFDPARGAARTWIYAVLRHAALNAARRAANQPAYVNGSDSESDEMIEGLPDPAAQRRLESQPEMGRLHDCLQALDESRRDCVLLSYVDGCSHAEIAQRLNAPLGTVKSWIKRALVALRDCMS